MSLRRRRARTRQGTPNKRRTAILQKALAGSIGISATANLNPERQFPSMFEPIHGSAFDITGKGIANPIGAFWTTVLRIEPWCELYQRDRHDAARECWWRWRRGTWTVP